MGCEFSSPRIAVLPSLNRRGRCSHHPRPAIQRILSAGFRPADLRPEASIHKAVPFAVVSFAQRLKNKARRFLERPGTTVDLRRIVDLVPYIDDRGEELADLSDAELTAAAAEAADFVEICAVGREAAARALGERPYEVQLIAVIAMLNGNVAEMA